MPWCDGCDRFYNPNTLEVDGSCPQCGRLVGEAATARAELSTGRAPWHFKVLVAATTVYLSWRLVGGVIWVAEHL